MKRRETNELATTSNGALGTVWIKDTYSLLSVGIEIILKKSGTRVHRGPGAPQGPAPCVIVYCLEALEDKEDDLASRVRGLRELAPDAAIVIFGASADLSLARAAVLTGAEGFLHAEMPPGQITRALRKAQDGELVWPRELLMGLISEMVAKEREPDLSGLGPRKVEILEMVAEGLSNAQIGKKLYLSESTVKQHLRSAYKALGVKNRNQAAWLVRNSNPSGGAGGRRD
jgi:DNA-binding NarL/FixJ family response regulator